MCLLKRKYFKRSLFGDFVRDNWLWCIDDAKRILLDTKTRINIPAQTYTKKRIYPGIGFCGYTTHIHIWKKLFEFWSEIFARMLYKTCDALTCFLRPNKKDNDADFYFFTDSGKLIFAIKSSSAVIKMIKKSLKKYFN